MKPKAKMLLLAWGLLLPYMAFILYHAFSDRQRPIQFPSWFPYVGPLYFFGSIALLVLLRKKIEGDTPDTNSSSRNLKWLWLGVGLYTLIFLNGLRLGFANAGEVPLVGVIVGEVINGAILTTLILALRRAYKRVQQTGQLESGAGRDHGL